LNATAATIGRAVNAIEIVSYSLIILIGVRLLWVKGRAFVVALRTLHRPVAVGAAVTPTDYHHDHAHHVHAQHGRHHHHRHDHGHDRHARDYHHDHSHSDALARYHHHDHDDPSIHRRRAIAMTFKSNYPCNQVFRLRDKSESENRP
jgi:nickel/cobalt exporter